MKQLLRDLLVVALISGTMTCSKLPDDSLFQPVNFKPTITAPLPQITVVTEGRDTAVGVLVKGTAPFSYAWYKNNVPLNGFDSASLSLRNIQLSQAGVYSVIVSNGYGRDTGVTTLVVDSMFDTIAVSSSGKGAVSPDGNVRVRLQATPVFSYAPDTGNYADSVIVNGVNLPTVAATSQYTFSPITANSSFRVVFAAIACTLAIAPPVNGTITPGLQAKTKFYYGDTITLTAVPDKGYYFGGWGGDTTGTSPTLHLTMKSNKTISATFADTSKLSLTVSSTNGSVTLDPPGGTYGVGAAVKLTAMPNPGYVFSSWTDSAGGTKDTVTVIMNSKKTVTAVFSPISYTLTLSASAGGSITTPAAVTSTVLYGAATTITAAAQSSYTFSHWEVDSGTAAIADSARQSTSVTLTKGNADVRAVFSFNGYTLTLTSDSGLVSISPPGKTAFQYGDTARLTETPASGFRFSGWSGDTAITDTAQTSIRITFVQNRNIVANFTKKGNYAIIVSATGGSVIKSPDNTSYSFNDRVALTAVPDSIHAFDRWSGDAAGTANPCTVTVDGNKAVTANFVQLYTVVFNGNGNDSGIVPINAKKYKSSDTVTMPGQGTLKKTGYAFAGWTIAPDGSGTLYASGATLTIGAANATLYARWTANTYTITFNKNDAAATGAMAAQSIASGSSASLTANGFTKAGWTFAGWATTSTGAVVYADGASYAMETANVTLYAIWTAISYTITFNKNDAAATGTMAAQSIASGSSANLTANGFIKTGWTFAGWATTSTGAVVYADGASYAMGTANLTLYAMWTANTYTITFNKNDAAATGTMAAQSIASGSSAALSANAFTKANSTFAGWATTPAGSAVYSDGATYTMGSANVTLYAVWTAISYSITFNKNDAAATGTMPMQSIASGSSASLMANTFTKAGWSFAGWATAPAGAVAYNNGASYTMGTSDVTLYAIWIAYSLTIMFDKNDALAIGTMSVQTISSGSSANLNLNGFAKTGWSFAGWATTPAGAVSYTDGASYTMGTVGVTLYALWTINQYTVTYSGNGYTGGTVPAAITQTYQTIFTVASQATLTRTNYQFAGWNTKADGSGTSYAAGAMDTIGPANDTLFAKWAALSDADGNVYTAVTIGAQTWMVQNLKTTSYNDGTSIPLATDSIAWFNLSTPGCCWYNNDVANKATYGALYNWYTVNTGKLAPAGWHVATANDWIALYAYLGGVTVAGGDLKETGFSHWNSPNTGATNEVGFGALPGGYRDGTYGFFGTMGMNGSWWTSTEFDANNGHCFELFNSDAGITHGACYKQGGLSVRCVLN